MRVHLLTIAIVLGCLALLLASCGGSQGKALGTKADADVPIGADTLPLPGAGDRESSIVDSDFLWGNMYYDAQNNADGPITTTLESTGEGVVNAGYALYELAARAGETPYMLTVQAILTDKDPQVKRPEEGYWLAYGDFTGGGEGVWRYGGPYTSQQARLPLPAGINVVNDSGNVYIAVLALDSNKLKVGTVQIGYDIGEGYEAYRMAQPRGNGVGLQPQIEIDSDGNPQIAYLEADTTSVGVANPRLKVARFNGADWETQSVYSDPIEDEFAFACGSDGRRAVVVLDEGSDELLLLYDEGSGEFTTTGVIDPTGDVDSIPDIKFINAADDPQGKLDTVLVVYGDNYSYPDVDVMYYVHLGGVNPPVTGSVALATLEPDRLELMIEDNQATLGLLADAAAPPDYDCSFVQYSSAINGWAASAIPDLTNIGVEDEDNEFALQISPLGGGEYVAGYMIEDTSQLMFWEYDGVTWDSQPTDTVICDTTMPWMDFAVLNDGTLVFPANYGEFKLSVYSGEAGSGNGFSFHSIASEDFSAFHTSIAAAGTTAHIAVTNMLNSSLEYYKVEQDGTVGHMVADNGSDGLSRSISPTQTVVENGNIHVFTTDSAHLRVIHSENHSGQWVREADPILVSTGQVYFVLGAGYLETTGQLWVGYSNLRDFSLDVLTGTSDGAGGWDWETAKFVENAEELLGVFADDEAAIGCLYVNQTIYSEYSVRFATGVSTQAATTIETVTNNLDACNPPWNLGFNPVQEKWDIVTRNDEGTHCLLYHRNGTDSWFGPYTVTSVPNAGDSIYGAGFTYAADTGRMRLVTREKDNAVGEYKVNIYGQIEDDWNFAAPINVLSLNSVTDDLGTVFVASDTAGIPVVAAAHKLVADTQFDIEFFEYDGLGNWNSSYTWASPFSTINSLYFNMQALQVLGPGKFVFAATNLTDSTDPTFGIVFILYPW